MDPLLTRDDSVCVLAVKLCDLVVIVGPPLELDPPSISPFVINQRSAARVREEPEVDADVLAELVSPRAVMLPA